jgi:hypothetical protein
MKEKREKEKKIIVNYTLSQITRVTPHQMRLLDAYNAIMGIIV